MDNSSKPFVSVIIPTYHDWERLNLCIEALKTQTYPQERFEVIIVNNAPENEPPALNLPSNFTMIAEEKAGSYAARNAGINAARGHILAFTDSDCIPSPEWIAAGVNGLSRDADRVAGSVELFFKSDKPNVTEIYDKVAGFRQERDARLYGTCPTANMMARRGVFDSVGLFDASLFSGGDIEWGLRALEAGFSIVYCPEAKVLHPARHSMGELLRKQRRVIAGRKKLSHLRKNTTAGESFVQRQIKAFVNIARRKDLKRHEKFIGCFMALFVKLHILYYSANLILKRLIGRQDLRGEQD